MTEATLDTTSVYTRYRYPGYCSVGTDWLAEIPEHWEFKRLKWTITGCQNGVWGDEPTGIDGEDIGCVRVADFDRYNFIVGDDVHLTQRSVPKLKRDGRVLRRGDLLLEKSGGGDLQPVGAIVLFASDAEAVCSNFVARVSVADGYLPRFLCYLHAALYAARINTRSMKQSTGIQNLDSDQYFNEYVGLPPLLEQRAIAAFLDRETARIDAMIRRKQRLIELLEEKRQAVISHTVTKGLDPRVKVKVFDVEWLGKIPDHWEVRRLSSISNFQSGKAHEPFIEDEGPFICVNSRFVSTGGTKQKRCAKNMSPAARGDILMVMSDLPNGRALAKAFFVEDDGIYAVNQRVCIIRMAGGHNPKFFYYLLNRTPLLRQYDDGYNQTHLSNSMFTKLPLLVPPRSEQDAIVGRLDTVTASVQKLVSTIENSVTRLNEYRTALISAAVTGQIDVREEVELDG